MTEDIEDDFDGLVSASYSMDERQLLSRWADGLYELLPHAKNWAFWNAPDSLFEMATPMTEVAEQIAFGIEGYIDVRLADANLRELTELTEDEENEY